MSAPALVSPGHRFWPVGEAAQARLRDVAGARAGHRRGAGQPGIAFAARFARRGVAGLIAWPSAEPVFDAALLGAHRPPWTPHDDPRLDALANAFALLLNTGRAGPAAPTCPLPDTLTDRIKELPG